MPVPLEVLIAKHREMSLGAKVEHKIYREIVFIWENFHPSYRDFGLNNRDLGNWASPVDRAHMKKPSVTVPHRHKRHSVQKSNTKYSREIVLILENVHLSYQDFGLKQRDFGNCASPSYEEALGDSALPS